MAVLALGTAQFGLDYGLTNREGRLSDHEAERILTVARAGGVSWLDTAAAYGDAEARLGSLLAGDDSFLMCSKLSAAGELSPVEAARRSLESSLLKLRRSALDALLVHSAGDLLGSQGDALWAWLQAVREQGLVRSIGVSLYEQVEVEAVLARFSPDWVQLPVSVVDQRLLHSGTLGHLREHGVRIQARSLLLQGVLGLAPDALPAPLKALEPVLERLEVMAEERGMQSTDLALAWAAAQPQLDLAVVGVSRADELLQCIDAFRLVVSGDFYELACTDAALLDPRRWPRDMRSGNEDKA